MTAKCPNDKSHKKFLTTAHVAQTWEVDDKGNWMGTISTDDTTHKPDVDNEWICVECGATAEVSIW